MTEFRVTVPGLPMPKGSMKGYKGRDGKLKLTHDNPGTAPWGLTVAWAAAAAKASQGWKRLERRVPAEVDLRFYLPRPASAQRELVPAVRPDLDKLTRAIKDALTQAGVYRDDGQVTDGVLQKRYAGGWGDPAGPDGMPRVEVTVRPLSAEGAAHAGAIPAPPTSTGSCTGRT